jgi:hypothetical protein
VTRLQGGPTVPTVTQPPPSSAPLPPKTGFSAPGTPQPRGAPRASPVASASTMSPNPYAHLTTQQRKNLEDELKVAEEGYGAKMREANGISNQLEREQRLDALKNSYATKQSLIRKKYGVRLRERRTRAEVEEERRRMTNTPSKPVHSREVDTHATKRARVNESGDAAVTSQLETEAQEASRKRPGASGTSPGRSSSQVASHTYQQGNMRVEVHTPAATSRDASVAVKNDIAVDHLQNPIVQSAVASFIRSAQAGSESRPLSVADDSSSDSDSGGDIPAELPS